MIVKRLKTEFQKILDSASEIYIASAIVSNNGLGLILNNTY